MGTEDAESVTSLLREAIDRFGVDPRREPDRAVAIVADLAARPGRSSVPTIPALRSTLNIAAAQSSVVTTRRRSDCVAEATAAGVEPSTAASILDLVLAEAPTLDPDPAMATATATPTPTAATATATATATVPTSPFVRTRTALLLGGGAVAVVAIGLLVVILGDSDREPSATSATTSIAEPTPTAVATEIVPDSVAPDETVVTSPQAVDTSPRPTTVETEPGVVDESTDTTAETTVVIADFAPTRDGEFLVSREWRISDGEITTTVLLENPGDQPIAGLHREFPPPTPGTDPANAVWQPIPTSLIATTAVFGQVTLVPGQTFEITYRSPTSATDPTTQDVLDWYEAWRPQAEGLNAVLGTSAEFTAPEIRTE